ncbi:MAG: hypothetical protein HOW73_49725 [Polyangiaceae bacterium]|nr:hypothetical protein [Polyangiaceae bacterium]
MSSSVAFRWNIGDVSLEGYEALRLSVWGAFNTFGPRASYVIGVGTIPVETARLRIGTLPRECRLHAESLALPAFLEGHLSGPLAERVMWKLAPRMFPDRFEVMISNECILWSMPRAMRTWLESLEGGYLVAQNSRVGLRGLPPGVDPRSDLQSSLAKMVELPPSQLDEDALFNALSWRKRPHLIDLEDVNVYSPSTLRRLGRCGSHFSGLNASIDARAAWRIVRRDLHERVGIEPMGSATSAWGVLVGETSHPIVHRLAS